MSPQPTAQSTVAPGQPAASFRHLPGGIPGLGEWLGTQLESLVALYRTFHRAPELSNEERESAKLLARELRAAGAEVWTGIGGHGVVGVMRNGPGPTVMVRSDMDALPVTEATGLSYASAVRSRNAEGREVGVMHACGHDLHMANLVGVARYLAAAASAWRGTVLLVGQPAEEQGTGARAMLEWGLLERFPRPDVAFALHVSPDLPAGTVGFAAGTITASCDTCRITLKGRGGHGAYPHRCIDPVVLAAQLVLDLQTIVSRELPPMEPAVVTVGSIRGGSCPNVIAEHCQLEITLRSHSETTRAHLEEAVARKARALADAAGAPEPDVNYTRGVPSLRNDPQTVAATVAAWRRVLDEDCLLPVEPSLGAEDFAVFGESGVRLCMFRLGAVHPSRLERMARDGAKPPPLHSPHLQLDAEPALATGVKAMAAAVLQALSDAPKDA